MQQIVIEPDKKSYHPDEIVKIKIMLKLKELVNANAIYAIVYCYEKKKKEKYVPIPHDEMMRMKELGFHITTNIKRIEEYVEGKVYNDEIKIAGKGKYLNQIFEAWVRLPPNATRTSYVFGHDNKINVWRVKVKIDIPFAPDINVEKEIFVAGL